MYDFSPIWKSGLRSSLGGRGESSLGPGKKLDVNSNYVDLCLRLSYALSEFPEVMSAFKGRKN